MDKTKTPRERYSPESPMLQVRLAPHSKKNLDAMVAATGISNKTQLVCTSINLAAEFLAAREKGASIFYEFPDGTKVKVVIVGM
jgi:hypothetical protein